MGLDALKAAVEQVSVAPHRMERGNGQVISLIVGLPGKSGVFAFRQFLCATTWVR